MKVYIFGNRELPTDNLAFHAAELLRPSFPEVDFVEINPNQDVPFINQEWVILLDVVQGIPSVKEITEQNINQLVLPPRESVHDFDLGFQLKYLKKLGKIKRFSIIGLPMNQPLDYDSIHSIFKKLVAQDMQGS